MNFPMQTQIVSLIKNSDSDNYIFGKNKNYIIPEYQRDYSWKDVQIESFITSIKKAIEGEKVFMGTVQFSCESSNPTVFHIIDGQQRMTTFLLLCNLLGKKLNKNILENNNMSFDIKNFELNNSKLNNALAIEYSDIPLLKTSPDLYVENTRLLCNSLEELFKEYHPDAVFSSIVQNIYFVELVTQNIPLPQVVGIFNTINTTGLDLNCSDLFKLQYYEYLKKNYPEDENHMSKICSVYEKANQSGFNMSDVLDIYKHAICAKHSLKWDMLSKSNESFFDEIFTKKEPSPKAEILKFSEFEKIAEIYFDLSNSRHNIESINVFSTDIIWESRYSRYWTLPYVISYFNNSDYNEALKTAMTVAKYLIVCSVNFDKVINPVQTFMCNTILPAISQNKNIEAIINPVISKSPYHREYNDADWNKDEFKNRIKNNLFTNGKRTYIVCTLSALLEEINSGKKVNDIKPKLFNWKNFQFDIEHICARNIFEKSDVDHAPEYNGIGNLVVLNRSINRSIGDKTAAEKLPEYKNSSKYKTEPKFISVIHIANQIEKADNTWGIEQIHSRQQEQEKLLCKFLGLSD